MELGIRYRYSVVSWVRRLLRMCEHCGSWRGTALEDSRISIHWDGRGVDPNSPIRLCRKCARAHHDHWDEVWGELWQ